MGIIDTFRSFGETRDAAVVITLTRNNFQFLPGIIEVMSSKGIWTFFDLIHPDRGQPGSKTKNTDLDLLFRPEDIVTLCDILKDVKKQKEKGLLCHSSKPFLETVTLAGSLFLQAPKESMYIWNCALYDQFPSWVTIECDGNVKPCDDFYASDVSIIKVWEIADMWSRFCAIWKPIVKERCPGCLWNTHIDSHLIKRGDLLLTDYIHGTGSAD
jgi:MoaA/NifB/PqqE/SkfB family radical SAM enzyme